MSQEKIDEVILLLKEIRDGQSLSLERQARQLEIQEGLKARTDEQFEKANRLNDKAVAIQVTAESIQKKSILVVKFLVVIVILLLLIKIY
jgi:hypothetical protein